MVSRDGRMRFKLEFMQFNATEVAAAVNNQLMTHTAGQI